MFNKVKQAFSGGNKKQRALAEKEFEAEKAFAIKLVKLELSEGQMVSPFIKNSTDDPEFPSYIKREVFYRPVKMTGENRKEKEMFLKQHGIATKYDEGANGEKVIFFEKTEKPSPDKTKESI